MGGRPDPSPSNNLRARGNVMDNVTRREALKVTVAAGLAVGAAATARAEDRDKGAADYSFEVAEPAESCRLLARTIDGTRAEARVVPGFVNDTYILIVRGKKPYQNMRVVLAPRTYVRVPDYWG